MNNMTKDRGTLFIFVFSLILVSCKSENSGDLPSLETLSVTNITQTSAKTGGNIKLTGGTDIVEKGVCWATNDNPTISDMHTTDGPTNAAFTSILAGLLPSTEYHLKAYATNKAGTGYGDMQSFTTLAGTVGSQIIADHTVVDRFDDIPQQYIDEVKKMWLVIAGESHSEAYRTGLTLLEATYPVYAASVKDVGTPEAYTASNLRASRATWGDYSNSSGWVYDYGEEDWFTNGTALSRTKASISYCNTHNISISAIGFAWCYDIVGYRVPTGNRDEVYGCFWFGDSKNGPDGDLAWGLDASDYSLTGNSVNMDTYLNAIEEYINYCKVNGYATKVFFTTGPLETLTPYEPGYQGHVKHEYIRNFVKSDPTRILFDYADILAYNDDGSQNLQTWNGHTYPVMTAQNLGDKSIGHIGSAGAIRIAKAMWWMLARIAGWDGTTT
jgi:hypothetical protein